MLEVCLLSLPELVIKLLVLLSSPEQWEDIRLAGSLAVSIVCAAKIMASAEAANNAEPFYRRITIDYYGALVELCSCSAAASRLDLSAQVTSRSQKAPVATSCSPR